MKYIALITIGIVLSACGLQNEEADRLRLGQGDGRRIWTSGLSSGLDVRVSSTLVNRFGSSSVTQMMDEWNTNSSSKTFFRSSFNTTDNKNYSTKEAYNNDNELGIYIKNPWFQNDPHVSPFTLAITQYKGYERDGYIEITHADIIFNGQQSFSVGGTSSTYDYESVLLHELGHFIGFPHTTQGASSVMRPAISTGRSETRLYSYDIAQIEKNYSGLPSSSSGFAGLSAISDGRSPASEDSEVLIEVSGTIEMRADGECLHYEEGELVHSHY